MNFPELGIGEGERGERSVVHIMKFITNEENYFTQDCILLIGLLPFSMGPVVITSRRVSTEYINRPFYEMKVFWSNGKVILGNYTRSLKTVFQNYIKFFF